jgi:GNAT superfamily N-acetyltransferase
MHATQFSDRTGVRISRFDHNATAAVLAMVGRCSPEATYRRFHGVVDAVAQVTAQLAGDRHESFVATVAGRCVGLATLATDGASAHIGVLVEDAYQRCGVGAALACAVVARARKLGVATLNADVLAESRGLLPALTRIGPACTSIERGGYRVEIALGRGRAA